MMSTRYVIVALTALWAVGCQGLGVKPMPERLPEEAQQKYDYGWEHFVAAEAAVDRAALLDTVLVGQLWHQSVDRLHLRSERQVGNVLVVMETEFERANPDGDVFTVTFFGNDGRVLRHEAFTPGEIDATLALFFTPECNVEGETEAQRTERLARLAEKSARLQRVAEVFPSPPEPPKDPAEAKPE